MPPPQGIVPPPPAPGTYVPTAPGSTQSQSGAQAPTAPGGSQPKPGAKATASALPIVPRSLKTGFDVFCGILFLLLGLATLAYFGYAIYSLLPNLLDSFRLQQSVHGRNVMIVQIIYMAGNLFGVIAGLLLTLAGVFSLNSGRGRKPAYAAIVFMLFVILTDAAGIWLQYLWGFIPAGTPLTLVLFGTGVTPFYIAEVVFVLLLTILLPIKKSLKKKKKLATAQIAAPLTTIPGPQPAAGAAGYAAPPAPSPQDLKAASKADKAKAKADKAAAKAAEKNAKAETKVAKTAQKSADAELDLAKAANRQRQAEAQADKMADKLAAAQEKADLAAEKSAQAAASAPAPADKPASEASPTPPTSATAGAGKTDDTAKPGSANP